VVLITASFRQVKRLLRLATEQAANTCAQKAQGDFR
jgi:hypothetical protein